MYGDDCMKYLWEVILKAQKEGIPLNSIHFVHSAVYSAYMELSLPCLNQIELDQDTEIEINTYYRFYSIFKHVFGPQEREFLDLRNSLTNLILHVLAQNDIRKGMTKEEYYKKMLISDIEEGVNGDNIKKVFALLKIEEKEKLLSGWLRNYQVGSSLSIFIDMIHSLIEDSIVYHNNDCPNEILIYTGLVKTHEIEQKIHCLVDAFLDIQYHVEIYYEYHFGIIGIDDTMRIDEIAMY